MTSPTAPELPPKAYGVLKWLDDQPGNSKLGLPRGAAFLHAKRGLHTSEGEDLLRVLDEAGYIEVQFMSFPVWYSPVQEWKQKRSWREIVDRAETVSEGLSPDPRFDQICNEAMIGHLLTLAPRIRITEDGRNALAHYRVLAEHGQEVAGAGGAQPATEKTPDVGFDAKACSYLVAHPEWTVKRIAEAAGCTRQHLYKLPKFGRLRELLKSGKHTIPSGIKVPGKKGEPDTFEAWERNSE